MTVTDLEAAIPNVADGHHMTKRVGVHWTRPDGITLTEHGDSLGLAVHRIEGGDRTFLVLRTGALPLVLIPSGRIHRVEEL